MSAKLCIVVLIMICSEMTRGQSQGDEKIKSQAALNNLQSKLTTPISNSALSNFISNVHVSSFFKEGVNGDVELVSKFKGGFTASLAANQKIGKGGEESLPVSLTGVSPGTTISLHLKQMFGWNPTFTASDAEIAEQESAVKAYAIRNNISDYRTISLRDISLNGTGEEKKMALRAFNKVKFNEPFFADFQAAITKRSFRYTTDSLTFQQSSDAFLTPMFSFRW